MDVSNSETQRILQHDDVLQIFNSETQPTLPHYDVHQIWAQVLALPNSSARFTKPCTPKASLVRQVNNVVASIRHLPLAISKPRSSTMYLVVNVLCLLHTLQWPTGFNVVPDIDLGAVLGDLVAPRLHPNNRFHMNLKTWTGWEGLSYSVCKREEPMPTMPRYFVGMIVCSDDLAAACVIDWIVSSPRPLMTTRLIDAVIRSDRHSVQTSNTNRGRPLWRNR